LARRLDYTNHSFTIKKNKMKAIKSLALLFVAATIALGASAQSATTSKQASKTPAKTEAKSKTDSKGKTATKSDAKGKTGAKSTTKTAPAK
jgi:hypothetical protein